MEKPKFSKGDKVMFFAEGAWFMYKVRSLGWQNGWAYVLRDECLDGQIALETELIGYADFLNNGPPKS
jgi:hypothetical protein